MSYTEKYTNELKEEKIYEYRKNHKNCNWCHFCSGGFRNLDNPKIWLCKKCEIKDILINRYPRLRAFFCKYYWAKGRND